MKSKRLNRQFLTLLMVVVMSLTLGVSCMAENTLDTITVALPAFQDINSIMVGVEKGIFEKYGIELDILRTDWGGGNELLLGGQVDVCGSGDTEAITHNAIGADTTLAFPYWYFAGAALMYDPARFPAWKSYNELLEETGDEEEAIQACIDQIYNDNARIGLSSGGELPSFIRLIGKAGYTQEDFTIYDMAQEDIPPALFSGSLDIMIAGIPQRLTAVNNGYVALLDVVDFPDLIAHNGFAASREWVNENWDLAIRFQKALFETSQYVIDNEEESFQIIADSLLEAGTEINPDDLYDVWNIMEFFPSSAELYEDWSIREDGRFYWKERFVNAVESLESEGEIPEGAIDKDNIEDLNYAVRIVEAILEEQ